MPNQDHRSLSRINAYLSFPVIKSQNEWLDLLRSIAIILVILRHGERAVPQSSEGVGAILHNVFTNGWVGVDLFLVLSGYLITKSLLRALSERDFIAVGRYFQARAFRIIPAYYAVLFLVVLGAFPFYNAPAEITSISVLYHMFFLQDYLPSSINVVFWSLGVEEKFYILAPLIILLIMSFRKWQFSVLFLVSILAFSQVTKYMTFQSFSGEMPYQVFFETLRSPFHQVLEPLFIGVLIGFCEYKKLFKLSPRQAKTGFFALGLLTIAYLAATDFHATFTLLDSNIQPLILSVLFGAMVLCCLFLETSKLKGTRLWRPIARLSYSLYLVHFPLIPLAMLMASTTGSPWIAFWAYYILLSFLAACLLHFAVEKPFLNLKSRLLNPKTNDSSLNVNKMPA